MNHKPDAMMAGVHDGRDPMRQIDMQTGLGEHAIAAKNALDEHFPWSRVRRLPKKA